MSKNIARIEVPGRGFYPSYKMVFKINAQRYFEEERAMARLRDVGYDGEVADLEWYDMIAIISWFDSVVVYMFYKELQEGHLNYGSFLYALWGRLADDTWTPSTMDLAEMAGL